MQAVQDSILLRRTVASTGPSLAAGSGGSSLRRDPRVRLVIEFSRAFHGVGTSSHELEADMGRLASALGLHSECFATPTALFIGLGEGSGTEVFFLRMHGGELDLGRLVELQRVFDRVVALELEPEGGLRALAKLERGSPRYPGWLSALAFGGTGAGASIFLGGGSVELLASLGVGLMIGSLALGMDARGEQLRRIFEPLAACLAAFAATLLSAHIAGLSAQTTTLASLIVLVPGLALTQAMSELAQKNLASGTARLLGAGTTFLTIGFGAGVGAAAAGSLVDIGEPMAASSLPGWTLWPALGVTALSLMVLFRARIRDFPWIFLSIFVAVYGAKLGGVLVGSQFAASAAALLLALTSNGLARKTEKPAAVFLVPGLILLVPGSLGYRSLSLLMAQQTIGGVEIGFEMVLSAVGLVAGLLVANALLPPRAVSPRTVENPGAGQ